MGTGWATSKVLRTVLFAAGAEVVAVVVSWAFNVGDRLLIAWDLSWGGAYP